MKSFRYPMWKRLASLLLALILCLSAFGSTAFAEELLLWDEEPAEDFCEPELLDELMEGEAVEEAFPAEELLPLEEAIPAEADAASHADISGTAVGTGVRHRLRDASN